MVLLAPQTGGDVLCRRVPPCLLSQPSGHTGGREGGKEGKEEEEVEEERGGEAEEDGRGR